MLYWSDWLQMRYKTLTCDLAEPMKNTSVELELMLVNWWSWCWECTWKMHEKILAYMPLLMLYWSDWLQMRYKTLTCGLAEPMKTYARIRTVHNYEKLYLKQCIWFSLKEIPFIMSILFQPNITPNITYCVHTIVPDSHDFSHEPNSYFYNQECWPFTPATLHLLYFLYIYTV